MILKLLKRCQESIFSSTQLIVTLYSMSNPRQNITQYTFSYHSHFTLLKIFSQENYLRLKFMTLFIHLNLFSLTPVAFFTFTYKTEQNFAFLVTHHSCVDFDICFQLHLKFIVKLLLISDIGITNAR